MFKVFKAIKYFLLKIDLFGSSQLLRYKGQGCYQTLTGGVVTFILFIVFLILFMQNFTSMINKQKVTATDAVYFLQNPSHTEFKIQDSNFIFGVGISGLNLTDSRRYFDISLSSQNFSYGQFLSSTQYKLQQCSQQQWAKVNEIGRINYNKIQMNSFLCPKSDQLIQIEGKFTSKDFKLMKVSIKKCKNSTDPSRPCQSQEVINSRPNYYLNFYFMNAYVNSGQLQPVNYYLQDRNYFPFTLDTTIVGNIYLSDYNINTDNSLLPTQTVDSQTILLVRQLAQVKNSVNIVDEYIDIYLRKSPQYMESSRSFQKLDGLLSYIGGLFGFAVTFFFFMSIYTEASYEIQMGDKLFYYEDQNPLDAQKFNFLYFIGYIIYNLLSMVKIELPWIRMKKYHQCKEQVEEQLDLSLLMNKVTFLEKCMNILFEDHQFRAIYLQQKPTVDEAEVVRLNHGLNKIIHKKSIKIKNKVQQKMKKQSLKVINFADFECANIQMNSDNLLPNEQKNQSNKRIYKNEKQNNSDNNNDIKQKIQPQKKAPYDLMAVLAQFAAKEQQKLSSRRSIFKQTISVQDNKIINEQIINHQNQNQNYLTQIESQNLENNRKFINTAINDIRLIEEQAKNGDKISKKIYEKINNQIIQEQFLVLQIWKKVTDNYTNGKQKYKVNNDKNIPESKQEMQNIFASLFRSKTLGKKSQKQNEKDDFARGLQIILQTNDRIERSANL